MSDSENKFSDFKIGQIWRDNDGNDGRFYQNKLYKIVSLDCINRKIGGEWVESGFFDKFPFSCCLHDFLVHSLDVSDALDVPDAICRQTGVVDLLSSSIAGTEERRRLIKVEIDEKKKELKASEITLRGLKEQLVIETAMLTAGERKVQKIKDGK